MLLHKQLTSLPPICQHSSSSSDRRNSSIRESDCHLRIKGGNQGLTFIAWMGHLALLDDCRLCLYGEILKGQQKRWVEHC